MTTTNTGTSSVSNAISEFADGLGVALMNQSQDRLPPASRRLHRAILAAFVDTGAAPTIGWIRDRAELLGVDPDEGLARLAAADLVHTADGSVTVAYPFSGTPTPHSVRFDDGRSCGRCAAGTRSVSR